ncbi:MAG: FAD-dependent monooxygenase [Myxococcota bacterium]
MTDPSVVIAGAGPTGLMLAAELALAGVPVQIVERRATQALDGSRAGGLHARSLEVLDQRGIAERFVEAGTRHPAVAYSGAFLDITDLPTRFPYVLALWQAVFEPMLAEHVEAIGVPIRRACDVVGFTQDASGVDVALSDGGTLRAAYLVGCDGGRSLVRKLAGIGFPGLDASTSWMIAEVQMDGEPKLGFHHDALGTHAIGRMGDGPIKVVLTEPDPSRTGDPDLEELRAALVGIYGSDFGLRTASWISRFSDVSRQAATYRSGRVLLAGDAAHIHPPQGGQGMNTGLQDAVNLGWKLAQVVRGTSPDALLDTYHAERHPVGARVQQNTQAQIALRVPDPRHEALRGTMAELLAMDGPRRHIAGMLTGLDVHYDLGEGHPLLGRRMPDLDLHTPDGPTRVFALLRSGRPVLLGFDSAERPARLGPWAERVPFVRASAAPTVDLPVLGPVDVPPAVLVRPDGHVAWTGALSDPSLEAALATWFGPP